MSPYKQLKKVIQEANPEKFSHHSVLERATNEMKAITLADVLLAMRKYVGISSAGEFYAVDYAGNFTKCFGAAWASDYLKPGFIETEPVMSAWQDIPGINWNLKSDSLDSQSEETKLFLEKLLVK